MGGQLVKDMHAYLEKGQEVDVWICSKHGDGSKKIELTMVEESSGQRVKFEDLDLGQKHKGMVRQVQKDFAFIDINCERDGLLHANQLEKGKMVEDMGSYLE